MNYYIMKDNNIVLFDTDRIRLENTLSFMPQYSGLEIQETDRPIDNNQFADTEEYLAKKQQEEEERINYLTMTPLDFIKVLQSLGLSLEQINGYLDSNIEIKTIERTNDFHNSNLNSNIISASTIRKLITENKSISNYVPKKTLTALKNIHTTEKYFPYLKYKIISEINNLNIYQTVDEGIESRIKKYIYQTNSLEELVSKIKTKRYTYNKIKRMLMHILCGFTKEKAQNMKEIEYIRILGFNDKGKKYLNSIKKELNLPLVTKYYKNEMFDFEIKVDMLYHINEKDKENEYSRIPIH